jgi:hypothetical protein
VPATRRMRNSGVAIEKTDAPLGLFAALGAGLAVFLVATLVTLRLIYPSAVSGPSDAPHGESATPRLQIDPAADLAAHRASEQSQLMSYGWVDRRQGVVHIPVDQAMRDIAAAGIKDWPENAQ